MSGLRNIKNISKNYKEAEIYFHQDLDGICSFLSMKKYLEDNNIKVVNAHIIQYGSLEFNVKNIQTGRLPVIVDFAHVKDMFVIATDHHDSQSGATSKMSTSFKKSRSNVETISNEISNSEVFTPLDIELIKTIDSADYYRYGIIPEHVQNCFFKYNPNCSARRNRFSLGLVVNRLLLALKNKRIKINSLNGLNSHSNRNLVECLALDSGPSLYSLYLNIRHYIDNSISYEWNMDLKSYHNAKKLPTQEQIAINLDSYINSRKEYVNYRKNSEIEYDKEFKIIKQFDIGKTFETGSYDRYVPFNNFPDANWVCTIFKMGLIQISANPFKEKAYKNIHLGEITKELFEKHRDIFSNFRISVGYIKKINESESFKLKQKYNGYESIGFKFNDLLTFYKDSIYYLPNRAKGDMTVHKLDLTVDNVDVNLLKSIMNKLYSEWSVEEKQEMNLFKITGLSILETMSGGHPSITNIQGINYLDERRDAIAKFFGQTIIPAFNMDGTIIYKYIRTYEDIMTFMANEYINIFKSKMLGNIEPIKSNIKLLGNTNDIV